MCRILCEHNSKKHYIIRTFYPGGGGWCGRSGGGRGRWGGCFDGEGGLPTSGRGSEHPGALQGDHSSGWGCHSAMVVKEPCGGKKKKQQPSFLTLFIKGIVVVDSGYVPVAKCHHLTSTRPLFTAWDQKPLFWELQAHKCTEIITYLTRSEEDKK